MTTISWGSTTATKAADGNSSNTAATRQQRLAGDTSNMPAHDHSRKGGRQARRDDSVTKGDNNRGGRQGRQWQPTTAAGQRHTRWGILTCGQAGDISDTGRDAGGSGGTEKLRWWAVNIAGRRAIITKIQNLSPCLPPVVISHLHRQNNVNLASLFFISF